MNIDLLMRLTFFLVLVVFLVVYLTQIPTYRLNALGNFLKKVLGVLPITKIAEAIISFRKSKKDE
jgi:uncharacterized membrane protein YqjE|tara:strand:+ start:1053 stop:1247 length:195 start_codon:yes stop_codon:yes gene_type:complete